MQVDLGVVDNSFSPIFISQIFSAPYIFLLMILQVLDLFPIRMQTTADPPQPQPLPISA